MKRSITLLLALLFVFSISSTALAEDKLPTVGILQFLQHPALDAARDGFLKAFAEEGFVDGETVKIDYQHGQASQDICASIADAFIAAPVDLAIAIATPAVQALAGKTETIPILGTAVTDYVLAKLVDTNEVPKFNVSGTSDMNPVAEQVALIKRLVPDAKVMGLLYTSSEVNSQLQAGLAKAEAERLGMQVVEVTVNNTNDVQQAAINVLEQCDVLYIPTDNIVASSIALVVEEALNRKIPIAGSEAAHIHGGGTFTLGIDYFKLGEQTGRMAARVLRGEAEVSTMPIERQSEFEHLINKTFMDALGLPIPEELLPFAIEVGEAD